MYLCRSCIGSEELGAGRLSFSRPKKSPVLNNSFSKHPVSQLYIYLIGSKLYIVFSLVVFFAAFMCEAMMQKMKVYNVKCYHK